MAKKQKKQTTVAMSDCSKCVVNVHEVNEQNQKLRAEIDSLREQLRAVSMCGESVARMADMLRNERDSYRSALIMISSHGGTSADPDAGDGFSVYCDGGWCSEQARIALEK